MKKLLCLLLALLLLCSAMPALAADYAELGKPFQDFTVTTIDGEKFTLSKALETHDAVYINLFATWCPPCEMEFPYMQKAYEEYSGRVAMIVISIESTDSAEKLTDYRDSHDLTLPFAPAGSDWLARYTQAYSIPVSMVIDRFGNLALRHTGAVLALDTFRGMLDPVLKDDYQKTESFNEIPKTALNVDYPSDEALSAALNAEGSAITFTSDSTRREYPFMPAEQEGQPGVSPANIGINESLASCYAKIAAQAGDALAFDLSCDLVLGTNYLTLTLDGKKVKQFMGRNERTWALPLPEGEHEVGFVYDQWNAQAVGLPFLSRVRLLSGAEAEAALAALPAFPFFDETNIIVTNEGATSGYFSYMGQPALAGCILHGDTADIVATVTDAFDPDSVLFLDTSKPNTVLLLSSLLTEDGAAYRYQMSLKAENGENQFAIAAMEALLPRLSMQLLVMPDENSIQQVLDIYAQQGYSLTWVPASAQE